MSKPWIGIDLDGTLAHYDGWQGIKHIGDPIWSMVKTVKLLIDHGVEVRIFTARCQEPESIPYIEDWCVRYIGQKLPVTDKKDFDMVAMLDDRAYNPYCYECFKRSDWIEMLIGKAKNHNDPNNPDNPQNEIAKRENESAQCEIW